MTGANKTDPDSCQLSNELGHLSAAVGHHIINAFSAVVSNAEMIRSRCALGAAVQKEFAVLANSIVEGALDASQVARRLIDWTRRFTAIETQEPGSPPRSVDINTVIQTVVDQKRAQSAGEIEWVLNLGAVPSIVGDAAQLQMMFDHLIRNAREALPGGSGRVSFTTVVDARNWLVIEVSDSGSGMSPETLKRASEPFFTTKSGHDGVGLTIAQAVWRRHRGAVSIESTPGEGTTIRLAVGPLAAADHLESQAHARQERAVPTV
jgi:two-component system NtrC family sensor kinase